MLDDRLERGGDAGGPGDEVEVAAAPQSSAGKTADRPNLITGPVQVCWHKFARYFDVEIREVPVERDRLIMGPEQVLARVDENTIGVVATMGVTFTCQYEPVAAIAAALDEYERQTGLDVPVHVDAASGGFLVPFVHPELAWDFRLPRVRSINASGHKFGLAPLGVGWVVWRRSEDSAGRSHLPRQLPWRRHADVRAELFAARRPDRVPILPDVATGSRGLSATYTSLAMASPDTSPKGLRSSGSFELLFDGDSESGIPAVSWTLRDPERAPYSLFDLSDRLRSRGWQVAAYTMVPNLQDTVVMRILVRHGFSYDMANMWLEDVRQALEYFESHPITHKMPADAAPMYTH